MKLIFTLCAALLLLASCSTDDDEAPIVVVSADNQKQLTDYMVQFATMSSQDNEEIRTKLTTFYELATVNNCEVGNFGVVTPAEAIDYMNGIGFSTVREFHDWTIEYGTVLGNISLENPYIPGIRVIEQITIDTYNEINAGGSTCELQMAQVFNRRAFRIANTFGVQGGRFSQVSEDELFEFGGAFNTFVQAQELEFDCNGGN